MSTYYYFHSVGTNEYVELTSGSWYQYMDDLLDVLKYNINNKKSYKNFIKMLESKKIFKGFYDECNGKLSEENKKYFFQPLYNWAFKNKNITLINDEELYRLAVQFLCKEKGLQFKVCGWEFSPEIEKEINKQRKLDDEGIIDHYLKCVGKLNYDNKIMNEYGVGFEHALAELKAGARIHRKAEPYTEWWLENGEICWTYEATTEPTFYSEEVLADDWEYSHRKEK